MASEDQASEDQQTKDTEETEEKDSEQQDDRPRTEKPEVQDEHKEKAQEMRKEYVEERPTVIMPGSGGTVAGTAVNEWLEDDGSPKFGDESESAADKSGSDDVETGRTDDDKSYGDTVADDKERNERIRKAHDEAQGDEAQNRDEQSDKTDNDAAKADDEDDDKDDG